MGDRAQVAIKDGNDKVYLYTHWNGLNLLPTVKAAMLRGRERWSDSEYLARIIFCEMVQGQEMETTGYGISTAAHTDLSYPIPVLDCETQILTWEYGRENITAPLPAALSFKAFVIKNN